MKISNKKPPNYEQLAKFFDIENRKNVVFTYGDTVYAPGVDDISDDLKIHEATHQIQQGDNPKEWWDKYIADPEFRLDQELEAYKNQFKWFKKRKPPKKVRTDFLDHIASDLSSSLYGNIIDYKTARNILRKDL